MAIITPLLLFLKNSKSWKKSLTPGLISSLLLSIMFVFVRKVWPMCSYLPSEQDELCTFDWREVEMFMFFMCLMVLKNRTAVSLEQMITTVLMYSKLANAVLFYRLDVRLCIIYTALCLVRLWMFPENFEDGPEEITYFSDKTLKDVLVEDPKVTWVVLFHATWSPPCRAVSPAFSALSNEFAIEYLRFGKVDVGKYPDAAKEYGVSTSTLSSQLPTVIVFEDGKMADWRPMIGPKKKFIKYVFSEENMKRDFGMQQLHNKALEISKLKAKKSKKND
uniref:Thioredoxin-related transmembrane protein 2-B n=1 Tax=Phallusia mammillata TaxID=59560 RepID=A0A6F9DW87_9ASCI|nr:thioredoxin-related transmembrane protein 2-B [Phallusia mammillata]